MKKLFMITLGGKAKNATIEVHDVQFIIANSIEETYEILKENWYGIDLKLHIDAYKTIRVVDGYEITITDDEPELPDNNVLYFVNIGGYDDSLMCELHRYVLLVCKDFNEAKQRAITEFSNGLKQPHVDNLLSISKAKILNKICSGYIKLKPTDLNESLAPDWYGYKRLDTISYSNDLP